MSIDVGVYCFPNHHVDARNEAVHGEGCTEWRLVEAARPRWPGHRQPRVPLPGFVDEAYPATMARKIDLAAEHGVGLGIFDWYMYDDGPFLQRGLEEGYLRARNEGRVRFALMWANHDWIDIHLRKLAGTPPRGPSSPTRRTRRPAIPSWARSPARRPPPSARRAQP